MTSTRETGHVKNVHQLEDLITYCAGYGSAYQPSKADLTVQALTQLLDNSRAAIAEVNQKQLVYNRAVYDRQIKFEPLKKLSTRLLNALMATEADDRIIEAAKALQKKIYGGRSTSIAAPDPTEEGVVATATKRKSVSQQSYVQLSEHFSKLILLLQSEPSYKPNEVELQVGTLMSLLVEMNALHTMVMNTDTEIKNARIRRNDLMYHAPVCLRHCANDAKRYIKSIFGATSPQYKLVTGLNFKAVPQ